MKEDKFERRNKKRNKRKYGMRVTGKSIFVVVEVTVKKAKKTKR